MKKLLAILALASFVLVSCGNSPYSVKKAYSYSVYPGMEEWDKMTEEEKKESCKVPEELMVKMTTPALVETIMNYPLLGRVGALVGSQGLEENMEKKYNVAFQEFSSEFAGVKLLKERDDGISALDSYVESKKKILTGEQKNLARLIRNYITITKDLDPALPDAYMSPTE